MTFKTTSNDLYSSENESSEEDEESMAYWLLEDFWTHSNQRDLTARSSTKGDLPQSKIRGTKISNSKEESNLGPGFRCGLQGHVMEDCPSLQKKDKKRKLKTIEYKKAMIPAWGSNTNNSNDDEDQVADLGLMAKEEQACNAPKLNMYHCLYSP